VVCEKIVIRFDQNEINIFEITEIFHEQSELINYDKDVILSEKYEI